MKNDSGCKFHPERFFAVKPLTNHLTLYCHKINITIVSSLKTSSKTKGLILRLTEKLCFDWPLHHHGKVSEKQLWTKNFRALFHKFRTKYFRTNSTSKKSMIPKHMLKMIAILSIIKNTYIRYMVIITSTKNLNATFV